MSNTEKIIIDIYGSDSPPAAADFLRGATTAAEFQDANESPPRSGRAVLRKGAVFGAPGR